MFFWSLSQKMKQAHTIENGAWKNSKQQVFNAEFTFQSTFVYNIYFSIYID